MVFLGLAGGVVGERALTQWIGAFRGRRTARESPAITASVIAIRVLPILGPLLRLPTLSRYFGEGCGGR